MVGLSNFVELVSSTYYSVDGVNARLFQNKFHAVCFGYDGVVRNVYEDVFHECIGGPVFKHGCQVVQKTSNLRCCEGVGFRHRDPPALINGPSAVTKTFSQRKKIVHCCYAHFFSEVFLLTVLLGIEVSCSISRTVKPWCLSRTTSSGSLPVAER